MRDKRYTAEAKEDDYVLIHMAGSGYYLTAGEARRLRDSLVAVLGENMSLVAARARIAELEAQPRIVKTLMSQNGHVFALYLSNGQKIKIQRDGGAAWMEIGPTPIVREWKVGDVARTPFEPSGLVKILEIEPEDKTYGVTAFVEFLEDHSGYAKGSTGRYQLKELRPERSEEL